MEKADLTRAEFQFLTALLDGQAKTFEEVTAKAHWRLSQDHFGCIVRAHSRYGWIERGRFEQTLERNGRTVRQPRSCYRITEAGRRVWNETAEFWLFTINQAAEKERGRKKAPRPQREFRPAPLQYRPRRSDRLPNAEEADRLLRPAPLGFALLCRALWTGIFSFRELAPLRVADVDLAAGTINVSLRGRRSRIPIAPELRPLIEAAIGDRETGPVFCNRRGGEWKESRLLNVFQQLRQAAGLPGEIAVRGRMGTGGRNRRAAS